MTDREKQRLAKLTEKMEQMKAQKQDILTREKARQRKERTHRLIQLGALSEKYFDVKDIRPAEYENLLKMLLNVNEIGKVIANTKRHNAQNSGLDTQET